MKTFKFLSQLLAGLLILGLAVACEKGEDLQLQENQNVPTDVQFRQGPDLQDVAQFMAQNNMGGGAIFIDPTFPSANFGVLKDIVFVPGVGIVSGEAADFGGFYSNGDFWRENPDGTVTVKLTTNEAAATHINFATGATSLGTGHLNVKYTGDKLTFPVPFPPFELTFILFNPDENAQVIHGHANVSLNGDPAEDSKKLKMWWNANPGGQSKIEFELED